MANWEPTERVDVPSAQQGWQVLAFVHHPYDLKRSPTCYPTRSNNNETLVFPVPSVRHPDTDCGQSRLTAPNRCITPALPSRMRRLPPGATEYGRSVTGRRRWLLPGSWLVQVSTR